MKQQTLAVAAALTLIGSVAFAQEVKVDFDKDANFTAIKTFALKIGTSWDNPLSEKRVTAEIEKALTEKGWTNASEATADAIVVLHGATDVKKDLNTFYSGGYGGYGWRGMGGMRLLEHHRLRVHRGHAGRGHLRLQVEGAPLPGHGVG